MKTFAGWLVLATAAFAFSAGLASAADSCAASSGAQAIPLVELYTSEGCSSCPPADRWLSLSTRVEPQQANWLAFHVDYWDDIGWPDRFGSAAHSLRQRDRVGAAGSTTVYTPQVMVGNNVRAAWQDHDVFTRILDLARRNAGAQLGMRVSSNGTALRVDLDARIVEAGQPPAQLWLALYLDDQVSVIKAGENTGHTLHHDRVVQALWGPWPIGETRTTHPQELTPRSGEWGLVAFVQDARGTISQSLGLAASRCATPPPG